MKHYGVLIKSDNALLAEQEERFPISEGKKRLRQALSLRAIPSTLYGCECLLKEYGDSGEWHHVSKFANCVDYYDVGEVLELFEQPTQELLTMAKAKKPQPAEVNEVNVVIRWKEFEGKGRYWRSYECDYVGKASIRGDWIQFNGKRKKLSGNHIDVEDIDALRDLIATSLERTIEKLIITSDKARISTSEAVYTKKCHNLTHAIRGTRKLIRAPGYLETWKRRMKPTRQGQDIDG
ncbi:hypothetical protein [Bremerella alba]|uniref:Uncharacterized protein n=1 Tax=Bremerella alba TaxID=980252 RepID=A0A7V8V870_9BACT|nr:hypothetical protein [Bremerella alba]MBA2116734.1 hypothetical protein [Bremerella alba]